MIISLTGFMGCGKSSVGRKLSELLCCPFIDLDEEIEAWAGKSIPEIFAEEGEAGFRAIEAERLGSILSAEQRRLGRSLRSPHALQTESSETTQSIDNDVPFEKAEMVLALGGGTVMTRECAEIIHDGTICIYLKASVETLVSHLEGETANRPMLQRESLRDRISGLMEQRSATYESTAHIIIDIDGKTIDEIAETIIRIGIPWRR
jgi:shikimate kinase